MAKWGVREVSGARTSPVGIDQFSMLGVCTVVGDSLDRLIWLVRCAGVTYMRHDRTSFSGGEGGLINSIQGNGGF